jgi:hypothetical protein
MRFYERAVIKRAFKLIFQYIKIERLFLVFGDSPSRIPLPSRRAC